ncbi:MAG: hypothetical protein PGN33_06185 [Methylobacterium radiotolerans]
MADLDRRTLLANGAAAVASAALPAAALSIAASDDLEQRLRVRLVANIERSAADLADAQARGETAQLIEDFYGYGHLILPRHRGHL